MQTRLSVIDRKYQELLEFAKLRKQRLLDALSLYKLFNEADGVETWIDEKVRLQFTSIGGALVINSFGSAVSKCLYV